MLLGNVSIDIGIAPDHPHCVRLGLLVFGQVVVQHTLRFEPVGKLKAEHGIMHFAFQHQIEIFLRRIRAVVFAPGRAGETRHAPAEDYPAQFKPLSESPPFFIQPPADSRTAGLRIDAHFIAVKPFALGIVAAAEAIAGHLVPTVAR